MNLKQTFLLLICLLLSHTALAHKLNVFTYTEGDQLVIESYFADGKRVQNGKIKIYNDKRELINEGVTNEKGQYQFKPPVMSDMRIVIDAGMGHATEFNFKAATMPSSPPPTTNDSTSTDNKPAPASNPSVPAIDEQKLNALIEQSVANAVEPLTREINELKNKTSLSDIIGGFGLIAGALGLFAYMKTRKEQKN